MTKLLFFGIMFSFFANAADTAAPAPTPASPPYVYHPIDETFWSQITDALKDGNYNRVVKLSDEKLRKTKKDSLEYAEAQVALARALARLNLSFGATTIATEVIKNKVGTQTAQEALSEIEQIVRKKPVDEDDIYGELLNDLEFDSLQPALQDFVSYFQGTYNQSKGYNAWADDELKKITLDSYWDYKLRYYAAINEVAKGHIDSAIERFSSIANQQLTPPDIKNDSTHQYARLIFEKGDYPQAYKILKTVTLSSREKGLVLMERAWAKYYEKDYSKALGLLAALEAPIFDTSRTPESYILEMLMYKELCYYDAALKVVGEFNSRFGNSLKAIRKRQDLRKDQMIVNMSVIDRRLEKWVNFINDLKDEKINLKEYSWDSYGFYKEVMRRYDWKIKEVQDKLNLLLVPKVREVANQLLDWEEQVTFLDYQTRLDSLRVSRPEDEIDYKPEEIPHMTFDKMFWENTGEYWMDEIENYKVFVSSKCKEEAPIK